MRAFRKNQRLGIALLLVTAIIGVTLKAMQSPRPHPYPPDKVPSDSVIMINSQEWVNVQPVQRVSN